MVLQDTSAVCLASYAEAVWDCDGFLPQFVTSPKSVCVGRYGVPRSLNCALCLFNRLRVARFTLD